MIISALSIDPTGTALLLVLYWAHHTIGDPINVSDSGSNIYGLRGERMDGFKLFQIRYCDCLKVDGNKLFLGEVGEVVDALSVGLVLSALWASIFATFIMNTVFRYFYY
jgi:hypothetical protein